MDTVKLCPFCMKEIVEEGRAGYGRCPDDAHGWVIYTQFALLTTSQSEKIPSHLTKFMETISPKGTRNH